MGFHQKEAAKHQGQVWMGHFSAVIIKTKDGRGKDLWHPDLNLQGSKDTWGLDWWPLSRDTPHPAASHTDLRTRVQGIKGGTADPHLEQVQKAMWDAGCLAGSWESG